MAKASAPLDQRHILAQQDRRQRRTKRDGHHQIEGVELGERTLASRPQHDHQRGIGQQGHNRDTQEAGEPVDQHGGLTLQARGLFPR
jgi:hypothetical protein